MTYMFLLIAAGLTAMFHAHRANCKRTQTVLYPEQKKRCYKLGLIFKNMTSSTAEQKQNSVETVQSSEAPGAHQGWLQL
jgi:hypothetical protein